MKSGIALKLIKQLIADGVERVQRIIPIPSDTPTFLVTGIPGVTLGRIYTLVLVGDEFTFGSVDALTYRAEEEQTCQTQ